MKSSIVFALASLLGLGVAVPLKEKRDLVYQTVVDNVVETVVVTTTITLSPGQSPPSPSPKSDPPAPVAPPPVPATTTSTTSTTTTTTKSTPTPSPVQAFQPEQKKQPPPPVNPPVQANAKADPPKSSTTSKAPPPPSPSPQPQSTNPSSFAAKKLEGATVSADCTQGKPCKGIATNYQVGLGACGWNNSDSELVVAISRLMMGTVSNGNDLCGQYVVVKGPTGKTARAKVVDKCGNCHEELESGPYNLDFSMAMFNAVGPADGVIRNIEWYFA